MTAGEGEFLGLDHAEALSRMRRGKALIEDATGRASAGFIAPAWLYSDDARRALADAGFALVAQIGEQVDYLRFLPEKTHANRVRWWTALLLAGLAGGLLGGLLLLAGGDDVFRVLIPWLLLAATALSPLGWSQLIVEREFAI